MLIHHSTFTKCLKSRKIGNKHAPTNDKWFNGVDLPKCEKSEREKLHQNKS